MEKHDKGVLKLFTNMLLFDGALVIGYFGVLYMLSSLSYPHTILTISSKLDADILAIHANAIERNKVQSFY